MPVIKKVFIVIGIFLVILIVGYAGINLFGWSIYNSNSCERFNIDNIELRTGTNIPFISECDCNLGNNTKYVVFQFSPGVNVNEYIVRNKFEKYQSDIAISFEDFPGFDTNLLSDAESLFFKKGKNERNGDNWEMILDKGKLWIKLQYGEK